ncbi:MAG: ATP-dependent helicase [Planctomycetaceae bacterium]|nr:ATP-dependent helicase [Planctomycetaceae bacterium]
MMQNVQYRNVGNLGDIYKHAALVSLGNLLASRKLGKTINYLDTHAFVPEAPVKNRDQWNRDIAKLKGEHPSYGAYYDIEKPKVDEGQYLCSTGLALKVLGNPRLFLSENNPETFRELKRQLLAEGQKPACLLKALEGFCHQDVSDHAGPLLALFDPFMLTEEQLRTAWDIACGTITALTRPCETGAVLVFQYWKHENAVCLPAPEGYVGPVASVARKTERGDAYYHLSAYATTETSQEAARRLDGLGWHDSSNSVSAPPPPPPPPPDANTKTIIKDCKPPSPPRRVFERYIMADYSGAKSKTSQRDKIVMADISVSSGTTELHRGYTRQELRKQIIDLLREATKQGQRTIVGLDHQFSWPMAMLELCGLHGDGIDWRESIRRLATGSYGGGKKGPPLSHPSDFCQLFNRWAKEDNPGLSGPFFGRLYNLPSNSTFWEGKMPFRQTEIYLIEGGASGEPFSATEIGARGAVGGQTICGMRELVALIDQAKEADIPLAVWPFDGLSIDDDAYTGKHVCVEIYPTLLRPACTPQSDDNDAIESAGYVSRKDGEGCLQAILNLTSLKEDDALIRKEGWILGCRPKNSTASVYRKYDTPVKDIEEPGANGHGKIPVPLILTEEQHEIINCGSSLTRVVARAGTGKTFTMVRRACRILTDDPSARTVMLTFTRNAADDMRRQFRELGGDARRFEANTFHGFALKKLLTHGGTVSIGEGMTFRLKHIQMLNEFWRDSILEYFRLGSGAGYALEDNWGERLSRAINTRDPGAHPPADLLNGDRLETAWRALLRFYSQKGFIDFDIVMVLFEYLVRTDERFRRESRGGVSHWIVDELQDTNYPQLRSLQHLAGYQQNAAGIQEDRAKQVVVVGDDFQRIYAWRGAVQDIFDQFAEWGQCRTLGLRTSQRSGQDILNVVNASAHRLAKRTEHQGLCRLVPADIALARTDIAGGILVANSVVQAVTTLRDLGLNDDDITVLAYTNDTTCRVQKKLKRSRIPCDLVTARPADAPGVRCFLAVLSAWFIQGKRNLPIWWFLASKYSRLTADEFSGLWEHLVHQRESDDLVTLVALLDTRMGPALQALCHTERQAQVDVKMLDRVLQGVAAADSEIMDEINSCRRLAAFLGEHPDVRTDPLRVMGEMTRKDFAGSSPTSRGGVKISTIHQYKGLDNEAIILVYDFDFDNPSQYSDRLRMDYVARSRAKRWLIGIDIPAEVDADWP